MSKEENSRSSPYNFLPGLEDPQLAKSDVEGRTLETAILLLDNDHIDCTSQRGGVYFRIEILKYSNICFVTVSGLDYTFTFL